MNKKNLSESAICPKFIGPAVERAGGDGMMQIREEVAFTKGRIIARGKLVTRGKPSGLITSSCIVASRSWVIRPLVFGG